jgi:hypothetical protein
MSEGTTINVVGQHSVLDVVEDVCSPPAVQSPKRGDSIRQSYCKHKNDMKLDREHIIALIREAVKRKKQPYLIQAVKKFSAPSLKRVLSASTEKGIDEVIKQEIVITEEHNMLFIKRLLDVDSINKPSEYDLLLPHSVLVHNLKTMRDLILSFSFVSLVASAPLDTTDLLQFVLLNEISGLLLEYNDSLEYGLVYCSIVLFPMLLLGIFAYKLQDDLDDNVSNLNSQYTKALCAIRVAIFMRVLFFIFVTSLLSVITNTFSGKDTFNNGTFISYVMLSIVAFVLMRTSSKLLLSFREDASDNALWWYFPVVVFFITELISTYLSLIPQFLFLVVRDVQNKNIKLPWQVGKLICSISYSFFNFLKAIVQTTGGLLQIMFPFSKGNCCRRRENSTCCLSKCFWCRECTKEEKVGPTYSVKLPDNIQLRKLTRYDNQTSNKTKINERDVHRANEGWGEINEIYKTQNTQQLNKNRQNGTGI